MKNNLTEHVQSLGKTFHTTVPKKWWGATMECTDFEGMMADVESHLLLSQLKTIELVKEEIGNRASSFGNCIDPLDVVKSISHMIFKNPMQNSSDYQFLGRAQTYFEILTLLDTIIQDIKTQMK